MECPKCGSEIGAATYCGCGWKARKKRDEIPLLPERVKCAYDSCASLAIAKITTPHGWANLCANHYDLHYRIRADQTCQRLGLLTVAQKRAYVHKAVREMGARFRPSYMREPGEDAEEAA